MWLVYNIIKRADIFEVVCIPSASVDVRSVPTASDCRFKSKDDAFAYIEQTAEKTAAVLGYRKEDVLVDPE
jgi:hypothetical protein